MRSRGVSFSSWRRSLKKFLRASKFAYRLDTGADNLGYGRVFPYRFWN